MFLSYFFVLESLILDVHAIFYANTTVSTSNPSTSTSARPASTPITTLPTPTPSSTSNTAIITASALAQSSNSTTLNVTTTSLPYLITVLTTNAFGTSMVTECPPVDIPPNWFDNPYWRNSTNSTCCNYYNASGNVAAFDSWITASGDVTSPYVGAKYGCCGDCIVRANNIQLYYWAGATTLMECFVPGNFTDLENTKIHWTLPSPTFVDPAFGCSGSAPTPVTAVINNRTITSPTPWIGFTSIAAYDHCSQWWGMFPIRLSYSFSQHFSDRIKQKRHHLWRQLTMVFYLHMLVQLQAS